uniref:Adenosine deaminase n=1 Tax=Panagrolaimus sp. JU765 TaxID=591449 RepID=A0AC34QAY4_9BILA
MFRSPTFDEDFYKKCPKFELHIHLDGAIRFSTILELGLAKQIDLKGAKTVEELKEVLVSRKPASLAKVLEAFNIFLPCVIGDKDAIERIAYELCEDQSKNNVCYFEARYSPHLLCNTINNHIFKNVYRGNGDLTPEGVVQAVARGLDRGQKDFNLTARQILCCIRGFEHFDLETLDLVTNLKHLGVVAIDVAGSAHGADEQYAPSVVLAFQLAAERGIHRTAHAGESGGSTEVIRAIEVMKAERIGHGYRLTTNEEAYQKYAVQKRIHLEACPLSSVITGSVPLDWKNHPISRWAKDEINFSINSDDPTCFDNSIVSDLRLARDEIGLSTYELWKTQYNACLSSFLPDGEKSKFLQLIKSYEPDLKIKSYEPGLKKSEHVLFGEDVQKRDKREGFFGEKVAEKSKISFKLIFAIFLAFFSFHLLILILADNPPFTAVKVAISMDTPYANLRRSLRKSRRPRAFSPNSDAPPAKKPKPHNGRLLKTKNSNDPPLAKTNDSVDLPLNSNDPPLVKRNDSVDLPLNSNDLPSELTVLEPLEIDKIEVEPKVDEKQEDIPVDVANEEEADDEDKGLIELQQIQPEFTKSLIKLEERYSKEFFARHVLFEIPSVGKKPSKNKTNLSLRRRSRKKDCDPGCTTKVCNWKELSVDENKNGDGNVSMVDSGMNGCSSMNSEDFIMVSSGKMKVDPIDCLSGSFLNEKENMKPMERIEKMDIDEDSSCEEDDELSSIEAARSYSNSFYIGQNVEELEKQDAELDEKAENLIDNYPEWFKSKTEQILSILDNSDRYSAGQLQEMLSNLKYDKGKRTTLFSQCFHKSEVEIFIKLLDSSKSQVSAMISSRVHESSSDFVFFNESRMLISKLPKFPAKKFLKCHSLILKHVDRILLLGYLCVLSHFKPIGRKYDFIIDHHLNSMTNVATIIEDLLGKGFYDPGNKFIYKCERKLLGYNVHAVVIHYGQMNGSKVVAHDEDERKIVLIDGLKRLGITVDEICIADKWSEEDKLYRIEAALIMLNQVLDHIEIKRENYKIFLFCFDVSGDFAHLISHLHPNLSGIINFGFRTFTSNTQRGIPGDSICNTECPTLFILGEKSKYSNMKHLRTFKENFIMPVGSIVVGNADHHLKIPHEILMKKKISQACVDRIVLEHVADFLDICCVSGDDMEPNERCQSPFDLIVDTDENLTDAGIKEKNQPKEKKISKRTITKTTEEDRRKFQDILEHIRESDSGKMKYKYDLSFYPWLKERPKLPEISGINFEALDAALAAPNPEEELSEPYGRESSIVEDRMAKHEEKIIKAQFKRRKKDIWKDSDEESKEIKEILRAADKALKELDEKEERQQEIPKAQPRRTYTVENPPRPRPTYQTSYMTTINRVNNYQPSSSTSSIAYAVGPATSLYVPYNGNTRFIYNNQPIRVPHYQQIIVTTSMPQTTIPRPPQRFTQLRQIRPLHPISIVRKADHDDQLSPEM